MPSQSRGAEAAKFQMLWHAQREAFVHDDAFGITTVGHGAGVFIGAVTGKGRAFFGKLFEAVLAAFAFAARIHHATDAGNVAFLELFDVRTHFGYASDDFMAGHARIRGAMPLVADDVQIRMADAAKKNLDLHVVRAGIAALNGSGCEK